MKLCSINEANWYDKTKYNDPMDLLRSFASKHKSEIGNWFVSMTDINKLGIHPGSKFKTPIGIYSYPLEYVISRHNIEELPFASKRPYINLFKVDTSDGILYSDDPKSITDSLLNDLYEKYPRMSKLKIDRYDFRSNISEIWLRTWVYVSKDAKKWNHILRSVGVQGVVDKGTGTVHPSEPTQAVFFSYDVIKDVHRFLNKNAEKGIRRKKRKRKKEDEQGLLFYNDPVEDEEKSDESSSGDESSLLEHIFKIRNSIKNWNPKGLVSNILKFLSDEKHQNNYGDHLQVNNRIYKNLVKYEKDGLIPGIVKEINNIKDQVPISLSNSIYSFNNIIIQSAIDDHRYDIALGITKIIYVPIILYQDIFKIMSNMSIELKSNDLAINNEHTSKEEKDELIYSSKKIIESLSEILFNEESLMDEVDMDDFVNFILSKDGLHPDIDVILRKFMKNQFGWEEYKD
jgi:hypothetical protein